MVGKYMGFRICCFECGLIDSSFEGKRFTGNNGRQGVDNVKKRFGRALGNDKWMELFLVAQVVGHRLAMGSDHCPMVLNFVSKDLKGHEPSRFEAPSSSEEECDKIIRHRWSTGCQGPAMKQFVTEFETLRKLPTLLE
ncbi:hypothetical protein SLA2020_103430 [Shorea laevis]